jgi:hypothetical protein
MTKRLCLHALFAFFAVAGLVAPVAAQEPAQPSCYWCIRDAIYDDVKLIAHEEANPDLDEALKGPDITAARADIHRLRVLLGPLQHDGMEPCCYSRPALHIR